MRAAEGRQEGKVQRGAKAVGALAVVGSATSQERKPQQQKGDGCQRPVKRLRPILAQEHQAQHGARLQKHHEQPVPRIAHGERVAVGHVETLVLGAPLPHRAQVAQPNVEQLELTADAQQPDHTPHTY